MIDIASEEDLKNKIRERYFPAFSTSGDLSHIDFTVREKATAQMSLFAKEDPDEVEYFLWAEAKKNRHDIEDCLAQLVLTIGRYRIVERNLPPKYLGAFDNEKIAFVEFTLAQPLFNRSDFRWNDVTPSDENTPEFKTIRQAVKEGLGKKQTVFYYGADDKELKAFIKKNFVQSARTGKIQITKTNFVTVYYKWCERVKPSIQADWSLAKKKLILDSDFYLADLFVDEKEGLTIQDSLKVLLRDKHYSFGSFVNEMGFTQELKAEFSDGQKAYSTFWNKYKRPPRKEFWKYILSRRDLLVPQDVRERKGAFFTPPQWSDLSKKYLAGCLGENWQDEYYVWDCCCGTGNLEIGLTNRKNIFASTLDLADIKIINQMIRDGVVSNLFENHVFQFDFLNDPFLAQKDGGKLPDKLAEILNDPEKRKKLVIYINPPYAEATNARTIAGTGENRSCVATDNHTYSKYRNLLGKASNELFAQFFIRIHQEIPGCILGQFSKLKTLLGDNFKVFLQTFDARLQSLFIVRGDTFDNVGGKFPIGFFVWDLNQHEIFSEITADVYEGDEKICQKRIVCPGEKINKWIKGYFDKKDKGIGYIGIQPPDFQSNKFLCVENNYGTRHISYAPMKAENLFPCAIYFAVRWAISQTWLNDRDQFLFPNDGWKTDREFQSDSLMFTLFHGQNRISCEQGVNHWIPFTEDELGVKCELKSSFMTDFLAGKIKVEAEEDGLLRHFDPRNDEGACQIILSPEAQAVRDAALALFRYYHTKPDTLTDASLYDIKAFFKGRNDKGKMNATSSDETFNGLMATLQENLKTLARKIEPKIYAHGFLA